MGQHLKLISILLRIWSAASPFIAAMYLIVWTFQFANEELFNQLDVSIGFLPMIFDLIHPVYIEFHGSQIGMSYVHCAGFLILTTIAAFKLDKVVFRIHRLKQDKELEERVKRFEQKQQQKIIKQKYPIEIINHFYALFEFKLEYYNAIDKSIEDLEKLKKEYSKMITQKLEAKYPEIKFSVSDKIFIYSNNFSLFNNLVEDLNKLYKIFYDIDYDKSIKTDLLLCFWCNIKKVDMKTGLKITSKINELNYLNKVIIADKFPEKYKNEKDKIYEIIPLGPSRLDVQDENGQDIEMDLFYIKK